MYAWDKSAELAEYRWLLDRLMMRFLFEWIDEWKKPKEREDFVFMPFFSGNLKNTKTLDASWIAEYLGRPCS